MDLFSMLMGLEEPSKDIAIARPPFGYPGGKSKDLKIVLEHLPYRKKYGEPFGGSGAVLLARNQSPLDIYNDRYGGVTCFYRCLRDRYKELSDRLTFLFDSREEFIWCRDTWKNCNDEVERAARWWYMHVLSFANIGKSYGRTKTGKGGRTTKLSGCLSRFHECHLRLQTVQIENMSWEHCIADYDCPDMVWYLDPPYLESQQEYDHTFTYEDHVMLLETIQKMKGFVAVSSYENELYSKYKWSRVYKWKATKSSTPTLEEGQMKAVRTEVLLIKEN